MSDDMPFGEILSYKRAPNPYADYKLSEDEAAATSQWDLAEKAIRATALTAPWLQPLVISISFDPGEAEDAVAAVVIRSTRASADLVDNTQQAVELQVEEITEEVLRQAFTLGLGERSGGAGQTPWDRPGVRWDSLRVEAARTLVGPEVGTEIFHVRDHLDNLCPHDVVVMNGRSWVETPRPGQLQHPVEFAVDNDFFEPGLLVTLFANWSCYGSQSHGNQSGALRTYFAELEMTGWDTSHSI